jgi:pilus assembly protein CpaB
VENILPKGLLGTPRRAIIAGVVALILAVLLLLLYLRHYRDSVKSSSAQTVVLVSKAFIPKGTTALALAKNNLYEQTPIPKDQLLDGAISDSSVIQGQVALNDVYPGHQLTTADFGTTPTSTSLSASPDLAGVGPKTGTWRAAAISLDASNGIVPQVITGDHVDIYGQLDSAATTQGTQRSMVLLLPDVLVLEAPNQNAEASTASTSANYVLRLPSNEVARIVYLSQNGKIWFSLRPQKGSKPTSPVLVNDSNIFQGPIAHGKIVLGH